LAVFRMALGLVMALEAYSLCQPNPAAISVGTTPLETYYTGADIHFHFPYEGFDWLPLLPAPYIYFLVGVLAVAGITMAAGFLYRISSALVWLSWTYLWVVESTRSYWQSHYYLEVLATFLMIWMPAANRWSVDAWLRRDKSEPENNAGTVPFWTLFLLRGQLFIAYFYAGVAKLNADWLLDAAPVRWFLSDAGVTHPYEPYLSARQLAWFKGLLQSEAAAYFFSYAGAAFDLGVGFLFVFRRTRILALVLMCCFHGLNHLLIFDDIGWFPLLGVTTALIFLDPDWPQRFWRWCRRPQLSRPDWGWLAAGAVFAPGVGAALGWKLNPAPSRGSPAASSRLGPLTMPFIVGWLVWQSFMPLRHFLIPEDARITYEGMSFSWRLKGEARRAYAHQLYVHDDALLAPNASGRARINWNEWHGDRVFYHKVTPGRINWAQLPEIVVLLEPTLGERVFYNPWSGVGSPRNEADSRARATQLWQELYGHPPTGMRRTEPLSSALEPLAAALQQGGQAKEAAVLAGLAERLRQLQNAPGEAMPVHGAILALLTQLQRRDLNGAMLPFLAAMDPFALEGEHAAAPFLCLEEPALLDPASKQRGRLNRAAWRFGPGTRNPRPARDANVGGEPLEIYTGEVGPEARLLLPQVCLFDSVEQPERMPYLYWNSLKDLTFSKALHVSLQAFYLRRYACRVASLWQKEYGRRPAVTALTAVSLNGRPHQALVDPQADLASVSVTHFGHNPWIRPLETPRIPREALAQKSGLLK
jgi:hypothetical protein